MGDQDTFFHEWYARRPGDRRSLGRARLLAGALGLDDAGPPVLTVVGSKGKGTAAAYASAQLSAAGRRVTTITSPGLRGNRERIRLDGRSVAAAELDELEERLAEAIQELPAGDGYLSPSGLFIIAGVLHARTKGADVIVLEAGRGGRSDEASLFPPDVAVITPIFEEHLEELGGSLEAIAEDKASIVGPSTRAVIVAPQSDVVAGVVRATLEIAPEFVRPETSGVPPRLLPQGLGAVSAAAGIVAARRLLPAGAPAEFGPVRLAGRLSWHRAGPASVLLDAAVSGPAVAAALEAARLRWGGIDHVLLSLPDDKDLDGAVERLEGLPVTFVPLGRPHLTYGRTLPGHWGRLAEGALTPPAIADLGNRVVALGTISFVGLVLDVLNVSTEALYG